MSNSFFEVELREPVNFVFDTNMLDKTPRNTLPFKWAIIFMLWLISLIGLAAHSFIAGTALLFVSLCCILKMRRCPTCNTLSYAEPVNAVQWCQHCGGIVGRVKTCFFCDGGSLIERKLISANDPTLRTTGLLFWMFEEYNADYIEIILRHDGVSINVCCGDVIVADLTPPPLFFASQIVMFLLRAFGSYGAVRDIVGAKGLFTVSLERGTCLGCVMRRWHGVRNGKGGNGKGDRSI